MVDRILHVKNKFSSTELSAEVVEQAAVHFNEKGMKSTIAFLIAEKGMQQGAAETLVKSINAEYLKLNKELLLYKTVFLILFIVILIFSIKAGSISFIVLAALVTFIRMYTIIKFIKNNSFTLQQPL